MNRLHHFFPPTPGDYLKFATIFPLELQRIK